MRVYKWQNYYICEPLFWTWITNVLVHLSDLYNRIANYCFVFLSANIKVLLRRWTCQSWTDRSNDINIQDTPVKIWTGWSTCHVFPPWSQVWAEPKHWNYNNTAWLQLAHDKHLRVANSPTAKKSIISSSQIYTYTSQLSASDSAIVRGYASLMRVIMLF